MLTFALVFALFVSVGFVSAITAKIGNARMVLYPEFENGKAIVEKSIKIINDNDVAVNVTLESDEALKDITEIIDENFILQPGEEKDAEFIITIEEEGNYDGRINIFFQEFGEKNGVALSSRVIIYASSDNSERPENDIRENEESENSEASQQNPIGLFAEKVNLSPVKIFFGGTTLVLIIVLAFLFYVMNKKEIQNLKKKRGGNGVKKTWRKYFYF